MKLHKIYNIVINDIIVYTSNRMQDVIKALDDIRKSEPKAYIQTCYA